MDNLGRALGRKPGTTFVKRDDLTGLAGGGNKARKLEYLCAQALASDADWLVTGGGVQSNHARMTAAAAAKLGLSCSLLLQGSPPEVDTGNLLLDRLCGAELVWTDLMGFDMANAAMEEHAVELRARGHRPFVVPIGGSTPVGALGMMDSALEVLDAMDVDLFVLATGSGGSHAGVAVAAGSHDRVLGVAVVDQTDLGARVHSLALAAAAAARHTPPTGRVRLDGEQLGAGYGCGTPAGYEAIELAARTEGLILDPVYTGKAMAGFIAQVRRGAISPDETVVFMHTGGLPGTLSLGHASWLSSVLNAGGAKAFPIP